MTSRRIFLKRLIDKSSLLFFGGAFIATSCSQTAEKNGDTTVESSDPCGDLSGISDAEIQKRESLGYVKQSPIDENQCSNCNLYLPKGPDKACGGCMLFKGPVYEEGYCTYWAPKV